MLLALSLLSFAFSTAEFVGYGQSLARYLDWLRVRSMQITLRDGEISPTITNVVHAVIGFATLTFFATCTVVTVVLVPIILIFGKETASNLISGTGPVFVLAALVFGPMVLMIGLGVVYLAWCIIIDLLSKALDAAHRSGKGMVTTVGYSISVLSFAADRLLG